MMLVSLTTGPYRHQEERYNSVRVLWAQVLKQAVFDYVKFKSSSGLKDRRDFRTAERWLFSDDSGLVHACQMLGWPLQSLRSRIQDMTKKDIRKMEFRDRDAPGLEQVVGDGRRGHSQ